MNWFSRLCLLICVVASLAACVVGIAHEEVVVPRLKIKIHSTAPTGSGALQLTAYCPDFWNMDGGTLELLQSETPKVRKHQLVVTTLEAGQNVTISFPEDRRYIGYPVIGVPFAPRRGQSHRREILIRDSAGDYVFRLTILGSSGTVQMASIDQEMARVLPPLDQAAPDPGGPAWDTWYHALEKFGSSIDWRTTKRFQVTRLKRNPELDELEIRLLSESDG